MEDIRISVRALGAAGDGRTDDTAAFEAALHTAEETGGEVLVPWGHYRITRTLTVKSRMLTGIIISKGFFTKDCLVCPNVV